MEMIVSLATGCLTALRSAALTEPEVRQGLLDMVFQSSLMVKLVLLLLVVVSVACWYVIVIKWRLFLRVRKQSDQFLELFHERKNIALLYKDCRHLEDSHLAQVFQIGYQELNRSVKSIEIRGVSDYQAGAGLWLENVERAMLGALLAERQNHERLLPLLATTGSTAPFIGLFGTVLGIMTSFQDIGLKGAANLAVVAPGISEALITTAVGLGAAIPAVVAYNHFMNKTRVFEDEMNHFSAEFLNILRRDLVRRLRPGEGPVEPAVAVRE